MKTEMRHAFWTNGFFKITSDWVGGSRESNFKLSREPQFGCPLVTTRHLKTMKFRASNRLLEFLEPRGRCVCKFEVAGGVNAHVTVAHITECEIDWESLPVSNAGLSIDFCISLLTRFDNNREINYDFGIIAHYGKSYPKDTTTPLKDGWRFDILWLSVDTFVTLQEFHLENNEMHVELMYDIRTRIDGTDLNLQACRLIPDNGRGTEQRPTPDVPLRFFAHLLVPIFHMLQFLVVSLPATPLVESALLFVPTTSQSITKQIEVILYNPANDLLRALGSHPVHPRVLLCLAPDISSQEHNDLLRAFRFPINLKVSRPMLFFKTTGESFAVNPAFTSLTIDAESHDKLSSTLIDGIACSAGIAHLTMKCSNWPKSCPDNSKHTNWMGTVFRRVLLNNTSHVRCVTLVSSYNAFDFSAWHQQIQNQQEAFNELAHQVCSQLSNRHGLSSFRLTFPKSCYKPCIASSELWDSRFVPSLLLNRLCEHEQGCRSLGVSGLAVQRINQGILYRYTTNLLPFNSSTSSASAIFLVLSRLISKESVKVDEDVVDGGLNEYNVFLGSLKTELVQIQSELDCLISGGARLGCREQANIRKFTLLSHSHVRTSTELYTHLLFNSIFCRYRSKFEYAENYPVQFSCLLDRTKASTA
jgi:hypothetical protein